MSFIPSLCLGLLLINIQGLTNHREGGECDLHVKEQPPVSFDTLIGRIDDKRKEYGRINSADKLARKKAKAAVDPKFAEELKQTNKGYKDKHYGKVKIRRVEEEGYHKKERAQTNTYQQGCGR